MFSRLGLIIIKLKLFPEHFNSLIGFLLFSKEDVSLSYGLKPVQMFQVSAFLVCFFFF